MLNPILQAMSGAKVNNIMPIIGMLKSGNPDIIYQQMMQTNPKFKQFVDANKDKSIEQVAKENGLDISMINQLIR